MKSRTTVIGLVLVVSVVSSSLLLIWIVLAQSNWLDKAKTLQVVNDMELHHGSPIHSIVTSDDGRTLISGGSQGVRIWEIARKAVPKVIKSPGWSLAYSEREEKLLRSGDTAVYAMDWRKPDQEVLVVSCTGSPRLTSFCDNEEFAICELDAVSTYDWRTLARISHMNAPSGEYTFHDASYGFKALLLLAYDRGRRLSVLQLWNRPIDFGAKPIHEVSFEDYAVCAALSRTDDVIACGCLDLVAGVNPKVLIWDLRQKTECVELSGHKDVSAVTSVQFSPDGKFLASAGGYKEQAAEVIVWEVGSWKPLRRFAAHSAQVTCLVWLPDAKSFVTGSYDGTVKEWTLKGKGR